MLEAGVREKGVPQANKPSLRHNGTLGTLEIFWRYLLKRDSRVRFNHGWWMVGLVGGRCFLMSWIFQENTVPTGAPVVVGRSVLPSCRSPRHTPRGTEAILVRDSERRSEDGERRSKGAGDVVDGSVG